MFDKRHLMCLGVIFAFCSSGNAQSILGVTVDQYINTKGAFVKELVVGGPAERAGIGLGDWILRIEDHEVYGRRESAPHYKESC